MRYLREPEKPARRRTLRALLAALGGGITWPAAAAALPAAAGPSRNGFDLTDALIPAEDIQHGGPPKDGIPAIDAPRFVAGAKANLRGSDRVLGIFRNGVARAYPIAILNWHEVVNDRFKDEPVVVTFCPLCGTGMAFIARQPRGALSFGVSGLLYNSDVLLYDRQTNSLWSQLMASAVSGPMKGAKLRAMAIAHTTWADWRARYPQTEVLSEQTGFTRDYGRDPYRDYEQSSQIMFRVRASDDRFHPKEYVIGLDLGGVTKAYPFSELARKGGSFDDDVGGRRVRVEFDAAHRTGRLLDTEGREVPTVIAFWFAWFAFNPTTEVFYAAGRRP